MIKQRSRRQREEQLNRVMEKLLAYNLTRHVDRMKAKGRAIRLYEWTAKGNPKGWM